MCTYIGVFYVIFTLIRNSVQFWLHILWWHKNTPLKFLCLFVFFFLLKLVTVLDCMYLVLYTALKHIFTKSIKCSATNLSIWQYWIFTITENYENARTFVIFTTVQHAIRDDACKWKTKNKNGKTAPEISERRKRKN